MNIVFFDERLIFLTNVLKFAFFSKLFQNFVIRPAGFEIRQQKV